MTLTKNEAKVLAALKAHTEGTTEQVGNAIYAAVYLDNVHGHGLDGPAFAGVLSSLAQKNLYRKDEGAFGFVLVGEVA